MRRSLIGVVVLALVGVSGADEFHLRDESGKEHGPFAFKQDGTVVVEGKTYTISKVLSQEEKIIEKMKGIVIPQVGFRQANILDVIPFLQESSREFDPIRDKGKKRGVDLVLNLPKPKTEAADRDQDPFVGFARGRVGSDVPLITFDARQISVHDALNIICKLCELQWSVQDSVVMVEKRK